MADQKLTDLTEQSVLALDDWLYSVDKSDTTDDAAGSSRKLAMDRLLAFLAPNTFQARLTTESGVPVSPADRAAQSTIYLTPYQGNRVALYDGTRWRMYALAEISLALSGLTADKNYDVFVYDNAGTLTLELSAAWTTDIARADALTTQDGVLVKDGATTRRYLGTIRTTGTTTTEDSLTKRFVWNMYNRVSRPMLKHDSTDSWFYDEDVFRQARATAANQLDYVVGQTDVMVEAQVVASWSSTNAAGLSTTNYARAVGIGVDSTSANSSNLSTWTTPNPISAEGQSQSTLTCRAEYRAYSALGRHTLVWLERCPNSDESDATIWWGDAGEAGNQIRSGIYGRLMG